MSGLYFKYGTMNSSKTANLLMTKHNYETQGFKVVLLKPSIDTRDAVVRSRIGLESPCTLITPEDTISEGITFDSAADVILVDECQFLTEDQVINLYYISFEKVVICYGLLTDFRRQLFPGSKALIEFCDSLQEIKSICKCGKRAIANARYLNDKFIVEGEQVGIEGEYQYRALCKECFESELNSALAQYEDCE